MRYLVLRLAEQGLDIASEGAPDLEVKATLDENVENLEALRQYLGLGPIVSIGASYGGRVAMAHAARHPSAVPHLVLVVTSAHGGSAVRALEIARRVGAPKQVALCEDLYTRRIDTPERMREYMEGTASLFSRARCFQVEAV